MRDIMTEFINHKRGFTGEKNKKTKFPVELPAQFNDVDWEEYGLGKTVQEGILTLRR